MKQFLFLSVLVLWLAPKLGAQVNYWQQKVKYTIAVNLNTRTNQLSGNEKLEYTNNSPDTLKKVFYHLYWNAFQPNSMMDVHNRELMQHKTTPSGWEDLQKDKILHLKPQEIGYQKVASFTMNGIPQSYQVHETILEVFLSKPILPHTTVTLEMNFEAQVPVQIRRSGRDNPKTGVRYSMSQWYPKICEYDADGWHPTPYVAREFYGVWGDYDVRITLDKNYILGGTGSLQNAAEIGYGYEPPGTKVARPAGKKLTWNFIAENVHDFMWAADPGYQHVIKRIPNGPTIHVLYVNQQQDSAVDTSWQELADAVVTVFPFIAKHFGKYGYPHFSVIQGGDGGMEYPMSCLVAEANVGSVFHEMLHSWYQGMLGTNESLYAWMDEGFTSYAYALVWDYYLNAYVQQHPENTRAQQMNEHFKTLLPAHHSDNYNKYYNLQKSGLEEPLATHADHFTTRVGYEVGVYAKGAVFLEQLGYIVGAKVRDKILLEYLEQWQFKHPTAHDFLRVAEKVSGLQLDWYQEYWINSTKTIDYAIDRVWSENGKTKVQLSRRGTMPMPVDLTIKYKDGSSAIAYIPQYVMFGNKSHDETPLPVTNYPAWKWTHPTYTLTLEKSISQIAALEIDTSQRMADVTRDNNQYLLPAK